MIERKIVIGLITSTDYLKQVRREMKSELMGSSIGRVMTQWCLEYYDQYHKAPGKDIETIFYQKIGIGKLDKAVAEEIEDDILPSLSKEYENSEFDCEILLKQTKDFMKSQAIRSLSVQLEQAIDKGDTALADSLIQEHRTQIQIKDEVDFSKPEIGKAIKTAFENTNEVLINYPGALVEFWNAEMVRGGFVAYLAPEKRGKTLMMMDAALRAARQGQKVAFFQAGDMTRNSMIRRIAINQYGATDKEHKVGKKLIAVKDCIHNQLGTCERSKMKETSYSIFENEAWSVEDLKKEATFEKLKEQWKYEKDYEPCHNCREYKQNRWGCAFLQEVDIPFLDIRKAIKEIKKRFVKGNRELKISTHVNGTLTVSEIRAVLDTWEMAENWKPDIIIIDYADLLAPEMRGEFRHQQNAIWKDLRGLNQERDCLLITATQADSKSYEKDTLSQSNFNEDKRKFGHVTAFYGLNQDAKGIEKGIGLLRINQLIIREDEFDSTRQVTVLQNNTLARPVIESYF